MSLLTNRMAEPRMRTDDRLSTIVISTGALDDLIVFWQGGLITIVSLVQPSHMTKSQVFAKQFSQDSNSQLLSWKTPSSSLLKTRKASLYCASSSTLERWNFDGWDKKWQKVDTSDSFCWIRWRKAGKSRIPLSVSSIWKNPLIICIRMLTTEKP